jgi:hypothetical protein
MGRMGRDEAIDKRGDLQASSYTKNQRHMGHGMHLLSELLLDSIIAHDSLMV